MNHESEATEVDPITESLNTYNELNSKEIEELHEIPSPLEFMRYVARNRPVVIRGGAKDWKATRTWNAAYLKNILDGKSVNVAITPKGLEPPIGIIFLCFNKN